MTKVGAVLLSALAIGGCGSSTATDTSTTEPAAYPWLKGPSREFLIRDGDNAVQTFGREATQSERAQASRVVAPWMAARAAKDHRRECAYLARAFTEHFVADAENVSKGKVTTCAGALQFFGFQAGGVNFLTNTFSGEIDSLRVEDGQGYVQFHGNDGNDYIVPMTKEDGRWKVNTAAPLDRSDAE